MNYLAHLYLAGDDPELQLGGLMGDFVKGPLAGRFPPGIEAGLKLHRAIDSFAHTNPHFIASRRRLDPALRHLRPLLVDVFYDHFLARDWPQWHPTPLDSYAQQIYRLLDRQMPHLPAPMQPIARRMIDHDWLSSYADLATVDLVLQRMGRRFRRPVDLTPGSAELRRCYPELHKDFQGFLQEGRRFAQGWRQGAV